MDQSIVDTLLHYGQIIATVVGTASIIFAALSKVTGITPTTKDDKFVSTAQKIISQVLAILDRLGFNPDQSKARKPKQQSMKLLSQILTLLVFVVDLFKRRQRKQEQEQYEKDKQQVQEDPAGWFGDHFDSGMPDDPNVPNDTDKASDTKPQKPTPNR